jgi:transcription initiation factor TFIID subunit 3
MSTHTLHFALLRPAVLQILRAAGYHAARPSVIDTLTDIAARYIVLLGQRTVLNAIVNHNTTKPTITDVRMAMNDCGVLIPSLTSAEEVWQELMRKPLHMIPEDHGLREKEHARRDQEDIREINEFIEWIMHSDQNREIRRITGMGTDTINETGEQETITEDYVTTLKKKHSKTGEESRYQGTVLGKMADDRSIKIEGGPVESIQDWASRLQQKSKESMATKPLNGQVNGRIDPSAEDSSETLDNSLSSMLDEIADEMEIELRKDEKMV